ncbi:MAG: hypothetical protein MUF58_08095 [Arcicella sp.]|nr:hypothetical protein [Arcicella sp.]
MKKDNLPYKASFRLFEGWFDFLALDIKTISWNLVNLQKLIFFSLRNALQRINSFYLSSNRFNSRRLRIMVLLMSLMALNKSGFAQSGTFSWYDGVSSGNVWNATDVSKTFTISCGTGCSVNVTMTIIDPNNRNADPNTYTTNPFDSGNGCLPYPNTPTVETDNVTGNGLILDPWDSDCNPVFTQTSGAYGPNFLTFAMNSFTHLEDVTIRFTFSKPVFLDNFTVGDIDGRTLLQDFTQNQTGNPQPLSQYESPGNSYQDEVTVTATGPKGNVGVNYSALGSLTTRVGQTVRSVYNTTTVNLSPDDARGTITVTTDDAITQLDITYSNGPDDGAAEQANPNYYSWWINGGTFTLSDGRTITQPAKSATNGASDNHAIRISGFNFTACPDFTFTRTNATVCAGKTATIGITPANGTTPYTYSWTGPSGFTSTSQNPTIANVTASQAGVYTVTAIDANGCTGTSTASVTVNPLPTPTISANSTVCVGANVSLTASGGNKYIWSGPNSFSSTLQTPTINNVSTSASGTYIVNVEGANGCTVGAQTILTVQPNPTPTVNSPTICSGESATLTVSNCTGGTVTWSNGLPSGTTATVSPTTTTTYTATCTVGTCTGTAISTVTVNPRPTPTVNSPTICSGENATLTVSNCTGGTVTWSNGLPSGTTATVSPTTTTTYTATCTVGTCTGTVTSTVTVNPRPTPTVNSPAICSGESATLTVSNCTGGTVTWSNGLPSGVTATVSPTTTTSYTATCTVGTCTGTATSTVTVNPNPTLSVVNTSCASNLQTYNISFTSNGTVTSTQGVVDNNSKTVSNIPIGTNVTLTASLNSCLTNLNVTSPVCNCPVVNPPVSGGDKTICANSAFPALSVTVGNNESANWYDINNNLVASNTTSYTPTTGGTYLVESYNLVDNCKSTTKTEVKLNITPIPTITPVVSIATCRGKLSNNDAKINFTATNGDKYHIVIGETVAVTDNYANASTLNAGSGSKINIANPSSPVKYTIRVYNGSNTCYTDGTVTLNPTDCKPICVEPLKCFDLKVKINK